MATKKKMLQAAAGSAGGDPLDITDVFSTYVYDGNGNSGQTINNGIDLDGKGGLVWFKQRNANRDNGLFDTVRGQGKYVRSNTDDIEATSPTMLTAFNSNGFTLGGGGGIVNNGSGTYVSWTFRKAKKFFDIVQYTGNGVAGRTIPHNLGCTVGAMFIKRTNVQDNWPCFHRSLGGGKVISINVADQALNASAYWNGTAPTDSVFTLGSDNATNNSGDNYIAYIFAHNNNDGEFGPDGDQDIIKCGNFTTQSSAFEVNLGFEPQWIMLKLASAGSWYMYDVMRGIAHDDGNQSTLYANQTYSEFQIGSNDFVNATPTGFKINQNMINQALGGNQNVIYMAIRRGTFTPPEDATKVFGINSNPSSSTDPYHDVGFTSDMMLTKDKDNNTSYNQWFLTDRLRGNRWLETNSTNYESGGSAFGNWDNHKGSGTSALSGVSDTGWLWKRAPGFFDIATYDGSNSTQNISHNLGVQPEMIWIKNRSANGTSWPVLFTSLGARKYLYANTGDAAITLPLYNGTDFFANTLPTSSVFTVGGGNAGGGYDDVGASGSSYVAYLFASLPGISKVGSYTGNSSASQNIDCGFTSGARFVLIKNITQSDNWMVYDSVRGIVSGNDPYLRMNSTAVEYTSGDHIDPYSGGFATTGNDPSTNRTGNTYIFYAIA